MIPPHMPDTIQSLTQNSRNFNHKVHGRTESEGDPEDLESGLPLVSAKAGAAV